MPRELTFQDGLRAAIDLVRAGAGIEMIARALPKDPAREDPEDYQEHLRNLRRIMDTGTAEDEIETAP